MPNFGYSRAISMMANVHGSRCHDLAGSGFRAHRDSENPLACHEGEGSQDAQLNLSWVTRVHVIVSRVCWVAWAIVSQSEEVCRVWMYLWPITACELWKTDGLRVLS